VADPDRFESGADEHGSDRSGTLAAVDAGKLELVKTWLARHGGRIDNIRDSVGRTALHQAAATNNYMLSGLVEGAMNDPYARDNRGLLAIDYPPGERETDARRILRRTFEGHQRSLKAMLQPTHPSIVAQPIDSWRRLARYRLLPEGKTALMIACEGNRPDVVRLLLKSGAIPQSVDWTLERTAVMYAIDADAGDCLTILLDADPALRDRPVRGVVDQIPTILLPLHMAAWSGKRACVAVLLRHGAEVDAHATGDRHAWTALHLAALNGHVDAVNQLLAAGADAALAENCRGFNALQLAMEHQHQGVIDALQVWAAKRTVNLLPFFVHDVHGTAEKFPLYQAPIPLVKAHCTICNVEKPTCPGVEYLVAPCPSCDRPRPWPVEFANEITRCDWCERQAEWPSEWPWESDDIRVCVDCLRAGHAAISHSTDLGFIDPSISIKGMLRGRKYVLAKAKEHGFETTVLETYGDGSQSLGVHLPQALIDDLMRTPRHPTL
jgi:ankyrin repeat protein